jgi:4'-phosphopantetheinyl transferase
MAGTSVAFAVLRTGTEAAEALLSRWITLEDQAHAGKYRRPEARSGSLLAHAALRALLARQTAQRRWDFLFDSTGKLRVKAPGRAIAVEASVAHTKDMIACAVSHIGPVGIDVEAHRARAHQAIARYGFGPRERAAVARHGATAFYRIWTLREAMGKATGQGLALATDGQDYVEAGPEQGCWTFRQEDKAWRLAHYSLEPGYSLALAVPGAGEAWRPELIERVDLLEEADGLVRDSADRPVENLRSKV